jgi:hypothetical protein
LFVRVIVDHQVVIEDHQVVIYDHYPPAQPPG